MPTEHAGRALVVIPGTVNYFYNQSGYRVADALRALGVAVDVVPVAEVTHPAGYDYGFVSNLAEVRHAAGADADARVAAVRAGCRWVGGLAIDCVATHWYHVVRDLGRAAGLDALLDLGLHDQADQVKADPAGYTFVFSGLTPAERVLADAATRDDAPRPFPWAFVGHNTFHRAGLIDKMLQTVDPRGFVYLPQLAPYTEGGSVHLNQAQFERVLRKSAYHVWCSHHPHFYLEPERFRTSLLTGCVPVKVTDDPAGVPRGAPFKYLVMTAADLAGRVAPDLVHRVRRQYAADWRRLPTLAAELARVVPGLAARVAAADPAGAGRASA